ncbi:MAG TPA: hypothetical protein VGJ13_05130 [Pseudonocardiaceae bacterium]
MTEPPRNLDQLRAMPPGRDRIKAANAYIEQREEAIAEAQRIRDGDVQALDAAIGATKTARDLGCSRSTVLLIRGRDTSGKKPRKKRQRW